jgi:hypothetical protein
MTNPGPITPDGDITAVASWRRAAFIGAAWAVGAAFPLAAITALVYRFPIPFADYASGPSAIPGALIATVFYGLLGGFVVLAVLGGLGGTALHHVMRTSAKRLMLIRGWSIIVAATSVVLLSVLDKIIGPW